MKRIIVLVFMALLAPVLVACAAAGNLAGGAAKPTAAPATSATPAPEVAATAAGETTGDAAGDAATPAELSPAALGEATYQGILDQVVTLSGGRFEGQPVAGDDASRPIVTLLPEPRVYGDLDGDGRADSAVLLVAESGGSGTFVYLAVVAAEDGRPANLATTQLGDRVQVTDLRVEDGQIVVTLLTQGPDDPMCCPTQQETRVYRVEAGELVQVP